MHLLMAILLAFCVPINSYVNIQTDEHLNTSEITEVFELENLVSEMIPLSKELQVAALEACDIFEVPYPLIFAVMKCESDFNTEDSNGICYGLMQIHKSNFEWLQEELKEYEVDNIKESPRDNIYAGAYMLGTYLKKYKDVHKALMAYNCGEYGAKKIWDKQIYQSRYSKKVLGFLKEFENIFMTSKPARRMSQRRTSSLRRAQRRCDIRHATLANGYMITEA